MSDAMFPQIAWRTCAPDYAFMEAWSLQHRWDPDGGKPHALCGAKIRLAHEGPGDSRRCQRCERIATRRIAERPSGGR